MSKLKQPVIALGAQGSLGDALSFARRRGVNVVEKKPFPTDPYTLAQAYQRWDYQDYAYQWHALSDTEKRTWHSNATRFHMTGFAYFMRDKLKTLPDLVGRWRLDERVGSIAHDSSPNANNGTIFAALPAVARIDYGRDCDGIDDRIVIPHIDAYNLLDGFSLEIFIIPEAQSPPGLLHKAIFTKHTAYFIGIHRGTNLILFAWYPAGVPNLLWSPAPPPLGQPTLLTITFDSATAVRMYFDDTEVNSAATPAPTQTSVQPLTIANIFAANRAYKGIVDNAVLYNRALLQPEIQRHSERGYPV